jgi:hypothetical protein
VPNALFSKWALVLLRVAGSGLLSLTVASMVLPLPGKINVAGRTLNLIPKILRQAPRRGWTEGLIREAIETGAQFSAPNKLNPLNSATRYVHPATGQSVVVDNVTNAVIHVGGPGFRY